jgi:MFS family permease
MIKKVVDQFLRRTHFWRDTGFDELSELYISNMLRSIALTIFLIFVPFYLYQNHYGAPAILALFGLFFVSRAVFDILGGYMVARFGPKHTIIVSNILQIISAALFLSVPTVHWNILILSAPWGAAQSLFFIAYHVSFSKIKHTPKAGAELGHMQVFEKVGYMLGPLIGGIIGSTLGPQYIFVTATALLILSLWPLFLSAEPVKVHQKLDFKGLPAKKVKRDILVNICLGIENTLCINTWSFYVAVFMLSGTVYAQLGSLSAVGVLAAIVSAKIIGQISDTNLARPLMHTSALLNAGTYLVRPFVSGVGGVLAVNVANEALTSGYRMPFMKGLYASADDLPGYRIVYISTLESSDSICKAAIWFALALLATLCSLKTVLIIGFAIAAVASIGITKERFAIYNQK